MLKLPVCPHCGAIYHYGEVRKLSKYKYIECRHCQKEFTVYTTKGKLLLLSIACLLLITLNVLLLWVFQGFTIYHCIGITLVICAVLLCFLPYTVKFKREKKKLS